MTDGVFTMPEKDVTFSAVWKEDANHNGKPDDEEDKFDIRYTTVEAEGVSGMPADVTDVLPGTQQTVSSASPVRDGYVFAGWTTGDVSVTDGVFTMPEKDVTFSAVWKEDANHNGKPDDEEDKFDIRYTTVDAAGVSGMPADVTDVLPGTQQTVSSASPVRDGYVFAGWTTGDVSVTDGVFTMPEKDVTFSAVWQQEENPSSSESSSSESSSGDGFRRLF